MSSDVSVRETALVGDVSLTRALVAQKTAAPQALSSADYFSA
jgi:hypothetical protein